MFLILILFLLMLTATHGLMWKHPSYSTDQLREWYRKADKSLLSIGQQGVTDKHVNSLAQLLKAHQRVRVKIATDRIDLSQVVDALLGHPQLDSQAELLEIRNREFMVGIVSTQEHQQEEEEE